jgi:thioesterase domain-containing protein
VLSAAQLRSELSGVLPQYMLPSAFVTLESFPVTRNGKLDRSALVALDRGLVAGPEYQAPQCEVESALARIWQRLLGLPRIGRHDDFFELGGHSLLVLKVVSAIQAEFSRAIPMTWIFEAPTPAQLAALMRRQRAEAAWKHLVALNNATGSCLPLFCLNGFDGNLNDYLHIARLIDPSVPVYGLQVDTAAKQDDLEALLATRMATYEREVRSVQPHGPYRLCGYSFGGSEAFDLAQRLEHAGEQVVLILLDAYRPSVSFRVQSWLPRLISMVRARAVLATARRKLHNLLTHEVPRWRTGKDNDLARALCRHAGKRQYRTFSGTTLLFKSNGIEHWVFQLSLDGFNGWKKCVTRPIEVIRIDVGHLAFMKEPAVRTVAQHLNSNLCDATPGTS